MVTDLGKSNSLANDWVKELRDINMQQDRLRFRRNMERIGEISAYEISKTLPYTTTTIQTPMGAATTNTIAAQPVLATILRAGLPLQQGLLNYFDKADCAFIGAYRKHGPGDSFEIAQEYITSPELAGRTLIVADPMLATGASMLLALQALMAYDKPARIHVVCAIASTAGIAVVEKQFPDVHIWTATIDEELTAKGYIVPGLGDAGDLSYGNKRQYQPNQNKL